MSTAEKPVPLPPGPSEAIDLGTDADSFRAIPALVREYGDFVTVPAPRTGPPNIVLADPEAIKHVLISNADNYVKGSGFERVKMLLGNGIIVTDGAQWRRQRTMMQPGFSRRNIEALTRVMSAMTLSLRERWFDLADSGATIGVTTATSEYALEIILKAIFGEKDYRTLTETPDGNPFAFLTQDPTRDLRVALKFRQLRASMLAVVEQRRAAGDAAYSGEDFLSRLAFATEKRTGEPMGDDEILDELMTLIIAGHETSAGTLNWAWYLLSEHPDVERKVLDELVRVTGGEDPTEEQLGKLEYLGYVLEETLRLYPPVWVFTRRALSEDVVGRYRITAGSNVFISPYVMQRHPAHWESPEAFRPERFADEALRNRNRYAFIPFSAGSRRCIGEYFSFVEMKTHLAMLLPSFALRYLGSAPPALEPGINLRSQDEIMMQIVRRDSSG